MKFNETPLKQTGEKAVQNVPEPPSEQTGKKDVENVLEPPCEQTREKEVQNAPEPPSKQIKEKLTLFLKKNKKTKHKTLFLEKHNTISGKN